MDEQQQLLLWQWSTAVQLTSLVMIATFFGLLARSDRRPGLRWWAFAWAANLVALAVTLAYWYLQPASGFPIVAGLYVGAKTAFVLLFAQGVWSIARPGRRLVHTAALALVAAVFGIGGAVFLPSIAAIGIVQHLTMAVVFLGLTVATARTADVWWLTAAMAVRGLLAAVEAGAYTLQLTGPWGVEWRAAAGAFMPASSAFDMSAEWLLVLGSALAVAARAQRELQATNSNLMAAHEQLRMVADRDPLTTLANRRALPEVFRAVQPVGAMLLFFDLDRFKELNDQHGHLAGDRCLRDFAGSLRDSFRPDDFVIRYGGDEFLVVARGLDRASAVARIQDLSVRVRRVRHDLPPYDFSVGIAELVADGHPEAALRVADAEMYRAKAIK
jgi:diguanylate cyclase (GGDEF)-like protein